MNFIDPESEGQGMAVFTPNVFSHKAGLRPCYMISQKEHSAIFTDYWLTYWQAFDDATPVPAAS